MNQRHRYPDNWEQESYNAKAQAGWMCEVCLVSHGAIVRSPRTGNPYVVYLQTAHVNHDQDNPHAIKKVVCPSCHARYYRRPRRVTSSSSVPILCKRRRAIRRAWERAEGGQKGGSTHPLRPGPSYARRVQFAWQLEEERFDG